MNLETSEGLDTVRHVVAVGASAGGLEALEALFENLSPGTGAAFVVITHLSPDFKSIMDELLARRTDMPVHVVEDGDTLTANCVYVIPPGKDMIVQSARLFLTDRSSQGAPALPIDLFLTSLAREYGRRATAIILSGTGADGARGAQRLHEAGGCVIAQSLETARFDGMPRAVAETGAVNMVLAPAEMGPALVNRFAQEEGEPAARDDIRETEGRIVGRILELVLGGANVDFSEYKKTTVMRRIARRMQNAGLRSLIEYLDELETSTAECEALANDLLIVVTEFFRDRGAFDALAENVIPHVLEEPAEDRPIRIWVPSVATGQEAYSIAMLLREASSDRRREPRVQIFATDVNPRALERAAAGVYTELEMGNVSEERRRNFFVRTEDGRWQVAPDIRNWIVFAQHNMLRDPPFINTDLISCRNALIYLEPDAQQKLLSLFHFSLSPSGHLFLGPSETIGEDTGRFSAVDAKWRLFRKRGADRRDGFTVSELIAKHRWSGETARRRATSLGTVRAPNMTALQAVLDLYAPPGLLVGRDRELLHVVGAGRDYLEAPQSGPFTHDVVRLAREPLRIPLATGIDRALRTGEEVAFTSSGSPDGGQAGEVVFRIHPITNDQDGPSERLFISFGAAPERGAPTEALKTVKLDRLAEQRIASLEEALRSERENLQSMLEELETSNEELQSTNEELMTANEELQSTNEELHSVNEELYTVNAEYERKNDELTQLSRDVASLLQATGVGVVFVDRNLSVRRFTPTAARVVNLIPGDEGRHLSHITHRFKGFDLCGWIEQVMARGDPVDEERIADNGTVWTIRVVPVREGRSINGGVVSLIEVSRLVEAEREARTRAAEMRELLRWVGAASLRFTPDGAMIGEYFEWERLTGQRLDSGGDESDVWLESVHPEDVEQVAEAWRRAHSAQERFSVKARLALPGGGWRDCVVEGGPITDEDLQFGYFVYAREAGAV